MKTLGWLFLLSGGGATGYAVYAKDSIGYKLNHFAYGTQIEDIVFYAGLGLLLFGFIFLIVGYLKPKNETAKTYQNASYSFPQQNHHSNDIKKLCKNCGGVTNYECDFCPNCGQSFLKRRSVCSECGNRVSENELYCANCGTKT
ncbi:MAG: zinc ribbon domain-containing protein [Clostridiaceae bacterium]|nr:zinc ribbon domain-containing protein [Clostridiaceae bacterium]